MREGFAAKLSRGQGAERNRMFVAEALGGGTGVFGRVQRSRPAQPAQLVLGYFDAGKRQVEVFGEAFTPAEFLSQLEGEHRVKPEVRQRRGIGFVRP